MKTTEFEAGELSFAFENAGIRHRTEPFSMGFVSSIYDSEIMPTDKNLFVNYEDLDRAKDIMDREYEEEPEPEHEDTMPKGKRIAVQIISVIAFLALTAVVVLCTDSVAQWFKGLFT